MKVRAVTVGKGVPDNWLTTMTPSLLFHTIFYSLYILWGFCFNCSARKGAPGKQHYISLRSSRDVKKYLLGYWHSDSWYKGHCPGMSVLFSAADQCWVSLECQGSDWKDPHSVQPSVKGSHDVSLTIGWCLLSHSRVSSVCHWCLKNRLHKHPWFPKKKKKKKSPRPSCLELFC